MSMHSYEEKALDYYGEVIINKGLMLQAGFGARSIPTYVGEWLISHFTENGSLTEAGRKEIANFLNRYLPSKGQKEEIKNRLLNMETVELLDDYSVSVNLRTGERQLNIPLLDITDAHISPTIVGENELLVTSGVWGIGELFYVPPEDSKGHGQVWMRTFKPFQVAYVDMDYFIECRECFETGEWLDLLVSSIGFNPAVHTLEQKMILLTRILSLVEPRVNIVELSPKGTGKSFVYDNLSRYARVIGGGKVSPAVLFHHLRTHAPGIITKYDAVVLDEVQSIQGDSQGELIAGLKVYLESGRFSRGNTMGTSECGFVMLGNTTLDENGEPVYLEQGIFTEIPNFLQETAFIDRIHGLIAGWKMPRIRRDTPSQGLGFKGDFFSEILHRLRSDVRPSDYVAQHLPLRNCDDLRDRKAITRLATGYLKLLFPNLRPSYDEYVRYCLEPAVELRQRIRDELHQMDAEYQKVAILIDATPS